MIIQRTILSDGVYLDLPEDTYHNATALGSGDIRRLAVSPEDFWFESKYNPLWRPEDSDTPAKTFGTAAHVMVLYGPTEFERRYAPTAFPGNIKAGIAERKEIREVGRIPLKQAEWERIQQIGAIVRSNPVLAEAFSNGLASELSVFWTADGIQRKCRIDYLKRRASVDLKTISPKHEGRSFVASCRDAIASYNYPVQAAHYIEGRQHMAGLIEAGEVYAGEGVPSSILYRRDDLLKAAKSEHAFVIVFVQSSGAPLTHGFSFSPGNGVLDIARKTIEQAIHNWETYTERFGLETPWLLSEPLDELAVEELPAWWGR